MSSQDQLFAQLAADVVNTDSGVGQNSRGSLVVDQGGRSTVRAMTSRGRIVVKLDRARVNDLVVSGWGVNYKGQRNEWFELDPELDRRIVEALVRESLQHRD